MMAVISWIHAVILFAGTYLPVAELMGKTEAEALWYMARALWLFIPVIAGWFLIRKVRSFPAYLLASAAVCAGLWLILRCPQTLVISVLLFVIRCMPRISKGRQLEDYPGEQEEFRYWEVPTFLDRPALPCWLILVALYFALIFLKVPELLWPVFALLVAEIFLTYCYTSLDRLGYFIKSSRRIANLPVKAMQRIQRAVLGVTVFLLAIFVLPSVLYGREPLTGITELKLNLDMGEMTIEEQQGAEGPSMEEMLEAYGAGEYKEPPKWLTQLLDVLFYVILMICLVVIALLIYHFCRRMMRSFADGQSEDEVILLEEDQDTRLSLRSGRRGQKAKSADAKIRKEYRKTILKRSKSKPAGWETPQELEEKYDLRHVQEQDSVFHRIYEKARYSSEECTAEDLEQFKTAQKNAERKS